MNGNGLAPAALKRLGLEILPPPNPIPAAFDFSGKMELSTWNTRSDWTPVKGRLWAETWDEAKVQLRGWMTAAAKGKTVFYIVRLGETIVRESAGPCG